MLRTPRVLAALLLSAALTVTLAGTAEAKPSHPSFPAHINLPDGFQPEGITIGKGPWAYLGSRADGDIYAANLRTGKGRVISQGPGTQSVGLKIDRNSRLFVAGGSAGNGRLVSVRSGKILASYTFVENPAPNSTFINDVVLTKRTAWFTDSLRPQLYGVARHHGKSTKPRTLPLTGDWVQGTGNAANGIAQTPDGRALLVIASNSGTLYRVNSSTGVARKVDLGGLVLTNGDGLLLKGRTLYVVQNRLNTIAVIKLNSTGTRGVKTREITSTDFAVPTTVASYRGSLYLPNARFDQPQTPTLAAWITRVND